VARVVEVTRRTLWRALIGGALLAGVAVLYARHLAEVPVYMSPDEVIIAVDAHSVATTGRDVHGVYMPLYFKIQMRGEERSGWFTPVIFYAMAAVLKVLPLSETSARLPSVLVGLIDVFLIFFVVRRAFKCEWLALAAAGMLALTPAHLMLSRYALDYLYPVPFLLGWLLCLLAYLEHGRLRTIFAATLLLGVGFYSYIAAVLMAPIYLLFTGALMFNARKPARDYAVAGTGFLLPLLMLVPWLIAHPTAIVDTASRYDLYSTSHMDALQGLRSFMSYNNLEERAGIYWSFLNPSFLFFTGDAQMPFSTRAVGVFLTPAAVLMVAGMCFAIRRPTPAHLVVLLGFFAAPLAAVLVPENSEIIRAAAMLPFGVLLAAMGVEALWQWGRIERARVVLMSVGLLALAGGVAYAAWSLAAHGRLTSSTMPLIGAGVALCVIAFASDAISASRIAAVCLLLAMPIQFAGFYRDYVTDYRRRSSNWLGGNLRGALVDLIDRERRDHAPFIYFAQLRSTAGMADTRNRWMETYWTFYLTKHGRRELLARSRSFDPLHVDAVPARSLVLANIGDPTVDALVREGDLKRVATIPDEDGGRFYTILQRQ
jgi:4-amino-4-deoxy-L-arabinose transferase-like glycosyltransferase